MQRLKENTERLLALMGFREVRIELDEARKHVSLHVDDEAVTSRTLPGIANHLARVVKLIAKKLDEGPLSMVDFNNYYREREKLIVELARAGARKASITKHEVALPPMNAYERRLVHEELAIRPDVKTESAGEGVDRKVIIKYLE
ncbi:MAG: hypothetical protein HY536_00140 [Candidatus Colwellbacteria bacterium]|nr:hypothetical protein [Candidatus Colwellbacteria bacterium]